MPLFIWLFLHLSPVLKFTVKEESMIPLLKSGDVIFVNRILYLFKEPKIGDIVVFKSPKDRKYLVKRIAQTRNNKYYVLGKNKTKSIDSRKFGWISRGKIIGKVIL